MIFFTDQQMSSQLTSFVPVLDGTNYQQWASAMQSYLMSQGQWKCVKPGATVPVLKTEATSEDKVTGTQEDIDAWHEDEEKALGNIRLCLHFTIGAQYSEYELPACQGHSHPKLSAPLRGSNRPLLASTELAW